MNKIKEWFISNILGGFLRHLTSAISGFLLANGLSTAEQAGSLTDILKQVIPAIIMYLLSQWGSVANKNN